MSWPQNCDAIILGCTELPLLLNEENCGIKVVDTTRILAHAALDFAVKELGHVIQAWGT
jgi:aspartate racemase